MGFPEIKNKKLNKKAIVAAIISAILLIAAGVYYPLEVSATTVNAPAKSGQVWYSSSGSNTCYFHTRLNYTTSATDTTYTINVASVQIVSEETGNWTNEKFKATLSATDKGTVASATSGGLNLSNKAVRSLIGSTNITYSRTHSEQTIYVSAAIATTSNRTSYADDPVYKSQGSSAKSSAITIPAKPSYTISYNANGGSGAPGSQTKWHDEAITLSSSQPTRAGYTFAGWKWNNSGTSYGAASSWNGANASGTFYAQWTPNNLTINYYGNGATENRQSGSAVPVTNQLLSTDTYEYGGTNFASSGLPNANGGTWLLTKPGYHANENWRIGSASGSTISADTPYATVQALSSACGQDLSSGSRTINLHADYTANSYTINYNPNGATIGSMQNQTVTYGESPTTSKKSYVKPGFRFRGWDRDPDADPNGSIDIVGDRTRIPDSLLGSYLDGTTIKLYAVWQPLGESEADIAVAKWMKAEKNGRAIQDSYDFRIEAVEGMTTENESTWESGQPITAADMPMPEGTPEGQTHKDLTVSGVRGNIATAITESNIISFEYPGWYMYKVTEIAGHNQRITYDKSSYFVICYVQYKEDTGIKVEVSNVAAWHNRNGLETFRPNTEDISRITDNSGVPASDPDGVPETAAEEKTFGKNGIGKQTVVTYFYNHESEEYIPSSNPIADLYIVKNVKGNLGDTVKEFKYTAELSGLAPSTTYAVDVLGATLESGFDGNAITSDGNGKANLAFSLADNESIYIAELPQNAKFSVEEKNSNHEARYRVYTGTGTVKQDSCAPGRSLSTGQITMSESEEIYTVVFDNVRELATNTGVSTKLPIAGIAAVALLLILFIARSFARRKV